MGDLTEYFSRDEFKCKCGCGCNTVDAELLEHLMEVRIHFGKPMTITSAHRCSSHNKKVGGGSNSQHLYARAADFQISGVSPAEICSYIEGHDWSDKCGLGKYSTFTHLDTRGSKARW